MDPSRGHRHGSWQLADTWAPFSHGSLPAGLQGTGRLVTVQVVGASRATFGERSASPGARLAVLALSRISGEARLKRGYLRVTVFASELSVLLVGALAAVFALGGAHFFLRSPSLGTALAAAVPVTLGGWIALQISRAGREVAADVVDVLDAMAPRRGPTPRGRGS